MIINKATYGGQDCTQLIRDKVVSDKLVVRSNNDIIGDTAVGHVKYLELDIDGNIFSVREGSVFVYPKSKSRKLGIFYSNNNNKKITYCIIEVRPVVVPPKGLYLKKRMIGKCIK